MEGKDDDIEAGFDSTEVDSCINLGSAIVSWPPSTGRMDVIGQNGNDGDHYDDD